MKAKFFLLGLCALGLMACSIDEVSQVNDTNAIQFKATTATRVAATTTNSIQEFTVWAWNDSNLFMDHVTAEKQSNGTFTTSPYYFWPTGTVDFYALYPVALDTYGTDSYGNELAYLGGEITVDEDDLDGTEYPVYTGNVATADIQEDNIVIEAYIPGTTDEQIDLCYAITKERSSGAVPMNFRHALSQVVFKAKDINADFVVDIAEVSICSVNRHGTYTLSKVPSTTTNLDTPDLGTDGISGTQGEWSDVNHKTRFEASCTPQTLDAEGTVVDITSDPLLLIPQTVEGWDPLTDTSDKELGSYIRVLCHVTEHGSTLWPNANETENTETINGVEYAYIAMPVDVDWEEGYRYTYTIIFGNGLGYYPPDDPNTDLEGTPVLVPITFNVTVDEFQDAKGVDVPTDTDLSYIKVETAAQLAGAVHSGYQTIEIAEDTEITLEGYLEFNHDCTLILGEGSTLTGPNATEEVYIPHGDNEETGYTSIIYVNGCNLTIEGDGTVQTTGDENAYYTDAIWVVNGSVTIYGGNYNGSHYNTSVDTPTVWAKHAVYCGEGGFAYIYGGTFSAGNTKTSSRDACWALNCHNSSWEAGHAMIYCYGGTYLNGFNPADPNTDDADSYVADGYGVTYDESNNSYTVVYTTVTSAADLTAALAAGASEITVSESFSIEQGSGSGYFWVYDDCTIVLEDGVTISLEEMPSIANYAFFIAKAGTLTIEGNGTLKSNGSTQDMGCMCFWLDGGDVVINGGNFYSAAWAEESSSDTAACVYVNLGTATINAGKFYGSHNVTAYSGSSYLLNCTDKNYKTDPRTADIIVYGGAFCDFDPADNYAEGEGTSFVADGYQSVKSESPDSDGWYWYTVVEE